MKRTIAILLMLVLVGAMGYGLFRGTQAKPAGNLNANAGEAATPNANEATPAPATGNDAAAATTANVPADATAPVEGSTADTLAAPVEGDALAAPAADGMATPEIPALPEIPAMVPTDAATPTDAAASADVPAVPATAIPVDSDATATSASTAAANTAADEFSYSPSNSSLFGTPTSDTQASAASGASAAVPAYSTGNENGYITLIDDIEVPAEDAGVLRSFDLQEGAQVKKGDLIAKLDDEQAQMQIRVADAKLKSAERQASNDVNIRYATAATKVALAEIQQADEANAKTPNTVTQAEVRRLMLAHKQAELQIEQATHEYTVAKFTVDVQKAELDAANLMLEKRAILSPMDGIVVEKFRHTGEWVKPGDPLMRLIRMDTMRIKFTLDAKATPMSNVLGHAVEVTVPLLPGKTFQGKVTFLSPVIESGTRYQVWAEITNQQENGCWILQPGMQANAVVK